MEEKEIYDIAAKEIKAKLVLEAILESDDDIPVMEQPCTLNKKANKMYKEMIRKVNELAEQGKCSYNYYNPSKPYQMHYICVLWTKGNDGEILLEEETLRVLSNVFSKANEVSYYEDGSMWQIGMRLYE